MSNLERTELGPHKIIPTGQLLNNIFQFGISNLSLIDQSLIFCSLTYERKSMLILNKLDCSVIYVSPSCHNTSLVKILLEQNGRQYSGQILNQ
jgi:hypothetical protein